MELATTVSSISISIKLPKYINLKGTIFILIKTKIASLSYLERPSSLNEIKNKFMR